ncbi:MAG: N-acetylneuraminate synthase [Gemmatimonadetes bacterium]|nr:MAG: N-acetylneuraminate synthase [Gemmatimonadota bacterium]
MPRVFIIAEAGVNHNGDINLARQLIDVAVEAKVDAVKFQTFKAEALVSQYAERAQYQIDNMGDGQASQLEMLRALELTYNEFVQLKTDCDHAGIQFLTTPFDRESADFIEDLVKIYKISSGEVINLPFLKHIATKGKPIILSTGMCNLGEVERAVQTIQTVQSSTTPPTAFSPLTLLHCTTNYPCPYEEVNLRAMQTLKNAFQLPVGYSDHTMGIEIPTAAAALGATVIEKHFTLDRTLPGPDHKASLEPHELKQMVSAIRHVETSLGTGIKQPNPSEMEIMFAVRKSLVATQLISAGERITPDKIAIKRPGTGITPTEIDRIIGKTVLVDIHPGEPLTWDHFLGA